MELLSFLGTYIQETLLPLGALGVFVGSIIEEVIAIIPSYIVQMGGGFVLLGSAPIDIYSLWKLMMFVVFPASFGVTLGSLFVYYLVLKGGKPLVNRLTPILGINWERVEKFIETRAGKSNETLIVLFFRILPFMPSVVVCAYAGFIRMHVVKYLILTFIGTLVRAFVLGFIGWQTGALYSKYGERFQSYEHLGLILLAVGIGVYILMRVLKYRKRKAGSEKTS